MATGWNRHVGEGKNTHLDDQDFWKVFSVIYSAKSKNTKSYKFGFLKSIIMNLYNVNEKLELTFDQLFFAFTEVYWNLVVTNKLKQGNPSSSVDSTLEKFIIKHGIPAELHFDKLQEGFQIEIVKEIKSVGKKYVIGALYEDTNGFLYGFDKKNEVLDFNPYALNFMRKHQKILISLTNYHFVKFIEKVNEDFQVYNLIGKVENVTKRTNLDKYFEILMNNDKHLCFYCGIKLKKESRSKVHIDHFIPWSFIQDDKIWNLVLSCSKCNLKKSDSLAPVTFLDKIIVRNKYLLKNEVLKMNKDFLNYEVNKLKTIYNFSLSNGYDNNITIF